MRSMMMILAGVALAAPASALAQTADADGWYGSVAGSLSLLQDTDGMIANAPFPGSSVITQNDINTGYGVQVAVGRRVGQLRFEAEVGYSRNKQDDYVAIVPATGRMASDVTQEALRGMANIYYDFAREGVQPYVGVGMGVTKIDVLFIGPRAPFPTEAPLRLIDDSDTRFTYQLIAGVTVPISPRTALTAQYRWLDAGRIELLDSRREAAERDHSGHNIDIGLRFTF